jgi:hypothetical protein
MFCEMSGEFCGIEGGTPALPLQRQRYSFGNLSAYLPLGLPIGESYWREIDGINAAGGADQEEFGGARRASGRATTGRSRLLSHGWPRPGIFAGSNSRQTLDFS